MKINSDSINHFFFKPNTKGDFLAFFRIAVGSLSLVLILSVWSDFGDLFGKSSIITADVQEFQFEPYIISLSSIINFAASYGLTETEVISIFKYTYVVACCLLIVGLVSKLASLLLLFLYVSFTIGSHIYGVDAFITSSLFYTLVFPVHRFSSIDSLILKKRTVSTTLYRRILQLHISMVYFFSGLAKSLGKNWWNGESVWKSIHLPGVNENFDLNWLAEYPILLIGGGIGILIIETLYPLFVWIPKTRNFWLLLTISMHVGIFLVLDLKYFALIMIIWNISAFYFKEESIQKI